MKMYWRNLFHGMVSNEKDKEVLARFAGDQVNHDLKRIKTLLDKKDINGALDLIDNLKKFY